MRNGKQIPVLLALLCLLLPGCAETATDEAAFGDFSGETLYARTATDEEAFGLAKERAGESAETIPQEDSQDQTPLEEETVTLEDEEAVPLAASPMLLPVAGGTAVESGGGAEIDYSNISDGYVMVRHAGANSKRLRVQVVGPNTTYTYDLPTGGWSTFPLSDLSLIHI